MNRIAPTIFLLAVLAVAGPGIILAADKPAVHAPATGKPYSAAETAQFLALARETLALLEAGKQTEMVAKLTDLETAWDDAEKALRPRDEARWTTLDKTLDRAISALRGSRYSAAKGKVALEELIQALTESTRD
mgnify:CR=1 FL=1